MSKPDEPIESVAHANILVGDASVKSARWEGVRPGFGTPPRSTVVTNWQLFQGMVVSIMFSHGVHHRVLGSGVIVAPGVALSAIHTFRELLPQIRKGEVNTTAIGVDIDGAQIWNIKMVAIVERTDVCVLGLQLSSELPTNGTFYQATITTRLPAIGETVVIGGFRAPSSEFKYTPPTIEVAAGLRISSGPVTEIFLEGRGTMIPWPAIMVDAPLYGGMSGGPVFDARGGLFGIASRSFDMGPDEEPSPMIVALLWPALGTPFPLVMVEAGTRTSLLDLHGKYLLIERPEAVKVEAANGPGEQQGTIANYMPWT
jgi:hypothetical protein